MPKSSGLLKEPMGNDGEKHRVLAVFAHPDDESYGPGATLARLVAEGSEVRLITLTRGESASMGDSPLYSPEFLAEARVMELENACRALGLSGHRLFSFPDKALETVPLEKLAEPVIEELKEFEPHLVIAFHPSGISGHPDHQCATKAAERGIEVMRSPTQKGPERPTSDEAQSPRNDTGKLPVDQPANKPGNKAVRRTNDVARLQPANRDAEPRSPREEFTHPRLAYYTWPESVAAKITWRTVHAVPDKEVTHAIQIGEYLESKIAACECHKTQRYLLERLSEFPGGIGALWTHEYFIVDGDSCEGPPRTSLLEGN
jgi:LmbE family N-acetylglucosaminyl deacetylase